MMSIAGKSNKYISNIADVILQFSTKVKKGETVFISGAPVSEPLIKELYRKTLEMGAFPYVRVTIPGLSRMFYDYASPTQLKHVGKFEFEEANAADVNIRIASASNIKEFAMVDPKKINMVTKARAELSNIHMKKRWNVTLYPTQAYAQEAEMSMEEYEAFVYKATFANKKDPVGEWKKLKKRQDNMVKELSKVKSVHIKADNVDLKMSTKGRKFLNSYGTVNMPSGEIFTGPVENSVNGYIKFSFPALINGKEIEGMELTFKDGKVVKATAEKNEDYLKKMLSIDSGAKYVGELGIGTNYGIDRYTKNILFDEKIGGTIHLALGKSYPETGGKNVSAIHWDIITDLRDNGELYLDNELYQKNGKFVSWGN